MTTKWTKGPWRCAAQEDVVIAKVFGPKHPDGGDYAPLFETYDHANAQLIASAPALYEALATLLVTDRTGHTFNCACDDCLHYNKSREDALAALRAARGEHND